MSESNRSRIGRAVFCYPERPKRQPFHSLLHTKADLGFRVRLTFPHIKGTTMAKTGPKPLNPTDEERELVRKMCAVGIPQESIARVIRGGIDKKTLAKYFRAEIDTAAVEANTKIGQTLFEKAMAGDTTAAIWWTKARMGWREKQDIGFTDKDGNDLNFTVKFVK